MPTANETVDPSTFFAPLIQVESPPPEDFDEELDKLEFDRPLMPFEDFLSNLRSTYLVSSTPSSFKFTYPPDSGGHMSNYSESDVAPSFRAVHGTPNNSNSSDNLPDSPQSFGSLPPSPVPSNHRISDNAHSLLSVPPDDRSRTMRPSASPDLPVHKKKKLKVLLMCTICKHRFSRRSDVHRHIEIFHEDHKSVLSTHPSSLIAPVPITGAHGT